MRDVTQNQRQVPNNPRKRKLPCFLESTFGTGSDDDGEGPCRKSCAVEFCQNFWEDCPSAPSTSGLKISDDNDNDTLTSLTCRHDHSPPPIEDVDLMRCCTKHGCTDCDLSKKEKSQLGIIFKKCASTSRVFRKDIFQVSNIFPLLTALPFTHLSQSCIIGFSIVVVDESFISQLI